MEIRLSGLILTACLGNFGLASVQLHDYMPYQNLKKNGADLEILKEDMVMEQEAFNTMKDQLWVVRYKNTNNKGINFNKRNINEKIVAVKRETNENNLSTTYRYTFGDSGSSFGGSPSTCKIKTKNTTTNNWRGVVEAVSHNDFEAVKFWVEVRSANLTKKNKKKQTVAHIAAAQDNVDILEYLLHHDKSTNNVNKSLFKLKDKQGLTVYHTAVENGAINSVKYLVDESKIDIDLFHPLDKHPKNSALHLAAEKGHLEVLKYLIEEKHADVNVRNKLQESPIFLATDASHLEVVKYLVEQCKADPTLTDWKRNNILHCAAIAGNLDVPRFLLDDLKIEFDVNARNDLGDTAVNLATKFNRSHLVQYLVEEKGANVNIPDLMYRTPLYQAAFFGYFSLVKYLVEHGADTKIRDEAGNLPLDAAVGDDLKKYLKEKTPRPRESGSPNYTSSDSSESIENTKMTTFDYQTTVSRRSPILPPASETPEEDVYIQHFGNDPYAVTKGWKIMRQWYHEIGEPKMVKMCALAHEKMGYGTNVRVWEQSLHLRELIFTNKTYKRRRIDIVSYRIEEGTSIYERRRYWFFTEGMRNDCVFYLLPDDPRERQFKLHKQVCGIKVF